ncbi:MAG: methyltransferase domain-containing protein [Acidobacteriota bacterium]
MTAEDRYMLGHDTTEWDRLREQHLVWRRTLVDRLPSYLEKSARLEALGGLGGARLLEVGCGNGALLQELAALAGPEGRTLGVEIDPEAASAAQRAIVDLPAAEVLEADLMGLELGERFDGVIARWVLSFLRDPLEALRRMASHLEPGGVLVIQDYDYDSIRMVPGGPSIDRLFAAVPKAYAMNGGDAWLATRVPGFFAELGLEWIATDPHCLAGPPSSPVARWAERFFQEHIETFVEGGLLTRDERDAALEEWRASHEVPGAVFFSPLVVSVVARKPLRVP